MLCGRSANVLDEANPLYDSTGLRADRNRRSPPLVGAHPKTPVANRLGDDPAHPFGPRTPIQRGVQSLRPHLSGLAVLSATPTATTSLIHADAKLALSTRDQRILRTFLGSTGKARKISSFETLTEGSELATANVTVKTAPKSVPSAQADDVPGLAFEGTSTFASAQTLLTPPSQTLPFDTLGPPPRLPIPIPGAGNKAPPVRMANLRQAEIKQANYELQQKLQVVYREIYILAPAVMQRRHGHARMFDDWLSRFGRLGNELCEYHYSGWLDEATTSLALQTCTYIIALGVAQEALYEECEKIRYRLSPQEQYDDYPPLDVYLGSNQQRNGPNQTCSNNAQADDDAIFELEWD